jgi:hypothetical protein
MKRQLTKSEEFDIMKMIMDKFLWLGIAIMGYGFFRLVSGTENFTMSFLIMMSGIVLLVLFMIILLKEYEFMKS